MRFEEVGTTFKRGRILTNDVSRLRYIRQCCRNCFLVLLRKTRRSNTTQAQDNILTAFPKSKYFFLLFSGYINLAVYIIDTVDIFSLCLVTSTKII